MMNRIAILGLMSVALLAFRARSAGPTGELHVPVWAFVTIGSMDAVQVVDLGASSGYPVIKTFNSAGDFFNPQGIVIAKNRQKAYVANRNNGTVSVIDIPTLTMQAPISITGPSGNYYAFEVALSPDEKWLWVTGMDDSSYFFLFRIDLDNPTISPTPADFASAGNGYSQGEDIAVRLGAQYGKPGLTTQVYLAASNGFSGDILVQVEYAGTVGASTVNALPQPAPGVKFIDVSQDGSKVWFTQNTGGPSDPAPSYKSTAAFGGPTFTANNLFPSGLSGEVYHGVKFPAGATVGYFGQDFPTTSEVDIVAVDSASATLVGSSGMESYAPLSLGIDPSLRVMASTHSAINVISLYRLDDPANPGLMGQSPGLLQAGTRIAMTDAVAALRLYDAYPRSFLPSSTVNVTLSGAGFNAGCTVDIGGIAPTSISLVDSTRLDVQFPAPGSAGASLYITVNHPTGQMVTLPNYLRTADPAATPAFFTVPPGSTAKDYRMFSLPQVTMASDLKDALVATFGPYNPSLWRAFLWSPKNNAYVEFDDLPGNPHDMAATAIWILSKHGGTVVAPGLDSQPSVYDFSQVLYPGWNMVSWPYATANGSWSPGSIYTKIGYLGMNVSAGETNPATNIYGDGLLFRWNAGVYGTASQMVPKEGYWVRNSYSVPCYLIFDDTGSSGSRLAPVGPSMPDLGDGLVAPRGMFCSGDLSAPLARTAKIMAKLPPPPPGQGLGPKSKTPTCAAPDAEVSAGWRAGAAGTAMIVLVLLGRRVGKGLLR